MAHASAGPAVMPAVLAALNVASLRALASGGVRKSQPRGLARPPYLWLQLQTEARWDCMGKAGKRLTVSVHVVTQAPDDDEAMAIVSQVVALLHEAPLAVTGWELNKCQVQDAIDGGEALVGLVASQHRIVPFEIDVRPL
jgi:hypothetical protein